VIRTAAKEYDIWQYIDPDREEETLTEPTYPSVESVNNTVTAYSQLNDDEKTQYQRLTKEHDRQIAKFDRRQRGMAAIMTEIQRTVSKGYLEYILEADSPRQMLVALKQRLATTDKRREEELATLYKGLQKAPTTSGIEDWLRNWESIYAQCKKHDVPDVHKPRAVNDFIKAVRPLSGEFYAY
jgi:hypothetical protein